MAKRVIRILIMFLIFTTMLITACGPAQYTLTTLVSPDGSGTISPTSGTYDEGTEVTLTATPAPRYRFDHWGGDAMGTSNSINVTMDANKAVTAYFKAQYTLSTSVSPSGSGTIVPASGIFDAGTNVTLTASPASGYTFDYWNGDATGTSTSVTITMDENKAVVAYFKAHIEGGILFQDDFTDNRNDWFVRRSSSDDEFYIEGGALHVVNREPKDYATRLTYSRWPFGASDFSNFGCEVDVKKIQGDDEWGHGLAFLRDQDTRVDYFFLVTGDGGYTLARQEGDKSTIIIPYTKSPYIGLGSALNKLKVICSHSTIELYVNDYLLKSVSGQFPSHIGDNGIGLVVDGSDVNHIAFDNLKMWVVTP